MAASEVSNLASLLEAEGSDGHVGMNVDEVLEATIDEITGHEDDNEDSEHHLYTQGLENLSPDL